jgi:hypothetical protein
MPRVALPENPVPMGFFPLCMFSIFPPMSARALGITQKTAWHMLHRLRHGMVEDGGLLNGRVGMDETRIVLPE